MRVPRSPYRLFRLLAAAVLGIAGAACADSEEDAVSEAKATPPCTAPEYRQFDFWIGDWDVFSPDGALVGRNTITAIHDGCGLLEEWRGAKTSRGSSLNFYDAKTEHWYQTWIDNSGTALRLSGGLEGGKMVLGSADTGPRHRITWTPLEDGDVKQHWEMSKDAGVTWSDAFVGVYRKRSSSEE